jgi:type II secretory pathway pseudopilin PulG
MRKRREEGFAMLLVFAMAAAVAIMLYRELPRLVFEAQRIKEQELIHRGLEYRRAIQLYVRKNKRYPQSLDDLERGTGIRYLRRRYKDPMTGKSEWRLIHIDNAGVFTDSLVHKPKEDEQKKSENTFITEGAAFGSTAPMPGAEEAHGVGAGVRGASDRPVVSADQFQGQGQAAGPFAPGAFPPASGQPQGDPQVPPPFDSQQPAMPGYPPGQPYPPLAGQPQPFPVPAPAYPIQGPVGQEPPSPNPQVQIGIAPYVVPAQPAQVQISVPGQPPVQIHVNVPAAQPAPIPGVPQGAYPFPQQPVPGQPNPAMAVGVAPYVVPGQPPPAYYPQAGQQAPVSPPQPFAPPGAPPYPAQGIPGLPGPFGAGSRRGAVGMGPPTPAGPQAASPQGNPALQLIQQILTTPRPPGMQGAAAAPVGAMIPGGVAGVATLYEAEGIMVFGERTKYNEWEFIYDYRQEQSAAAASAALGAGVGSQANPLGAAQPSEPKPSLFGAPTQPRPPSRFGATR